MNVSARTLKHQSGIILFSVILLILAPACNPGDHASQTLEWPAITKETKPWTRWWWPGNTLSKADLSSLMETYSEAGLGGVEITPTYGARGYEDRFIDYLSDEWMEMFLHTLAEGRRLDLGVDMATGTGWNHGGPTVRDEHAAHRVIFKKYQLAGGQQLEETIRCRQDPYISFVLNQAYTVSSSDAPEGESDAREDTPAGRTEGDPELIRTIPVPDISEIKEPIGDNDNLQQLAIDQVIFEKELKPESVMAYSEQGEVLDLTGYVSESGELKWTAPEGNWTVYALFRGLNGKMVERAGPGGEGYMINPFSKEALTDYLKNFNEAFHGKDVSWLRSYFNDSYEVDDARFWCNWAPGFLENFEAKRGYKLQEHLPALFGEVNGEEDLEESARVLSDYRLTITELMLESYTRPWTAWAAEQGKITRLQAHGSPANLLDLYAASDIPETEGRDVLRMKFASSAANVTGKKLVSSESATFLNENFTSTLSDLKKNLDNLFLGGVNHTFYHGTAYTPADAAWPGWFFYVAIHLNPRNPIWEDFGAFNAYVANVQSFLQSGSPDPDVLMYFPVFDRYARRDPYRARRVDGDGPYGKLVEHFNVRGRGWFTSVFRSLADTLQKEGYSVDYISDLQLQDAGFQKGSIMAGGNDYRAIILPECTYIPLETVSQLISLAKKGATVIIQNKIPGGVPGLYNLAERQEAYRKLMEEIHFEDLGNGLSKAVTGKGNILMGEDMNQLLSLAGVRPEPMTALGLRNIRRKDTDGSFYFMVNETGAPINGWVSILAEAASVAFYDPMNRNMAVLESRTGKKQGTEVYLQLDAGQSCILKTYQARVDGPSFNYVQSAGEKVEISGTWKISFLKGGPTLPPEAELDSPQSWTELPGEEVKKFSGTASYSVSFGRPDGNADGWWLDLGKVAESARVILNNKEMAVLIQEPYRVYISAGDLLEENHLEIRVSNLAANRIADMDREEVFWKIFYNNNIRPLRRENRGPDGMFSAAHWEPRESGLLGPVFLVPAKIMEISQNEKL